MIKITITDLEKLKNDEVPYLVVERGTIDEVFEKDAYDFLKKEHFTIKTVDIVPPDSSKMGVCHITENRIYK